MKRTAFLIAVTLACSTALFAQQVPYRYQLNTPYKYIFEVKDASIYEGGGQTQSVNSEASATFSIKFDSLRADTTLKGAISFDNAILLIESSEGMQTFGTDMAGKQFWFVMSGQGGVVDADTMIRHLEGPSVQLASTIMGAFPRLDPEQLKTGGKWTNSWADTVDTDDADFIITRESTFTVSGEKASGAKTHMEIAYESEMKRDGTAQGQGGEFDIDYTSKRKGTFLYNAQEGIFVSGTVEENEEQIVTSTSNPNQRQTMSSTGTTKLELAE